MGEIHIVALFIFVVHISLRMEIDVCVEHDLRWTELKGMEPYELLSDVLSIFIELMLNVCTAVSKLSVVLVCIITAGIELSINILVVSVIYVIEFSSCVVQKLVKSYKTCLHLPKEF